jgi:hypothetical protein
MLLLECCTDVVAGVVLYMFLLVWCCTDRHEQKRLYDTTPTKTSCTTSHQEKPIVQRHQEKPLVQHHQEKPCAASHKVVSLSTYCSCIILHPELPYILLCTEIFLWYFHKKGKTNYWWKSVVSLFVIIFCWFINYL